MEELEQGILLTGMIKAFGVAFLLVTIIYYLSKKEQNYLKYLVRSAGKGIIYGFISVIVAPFIFVVGVIISATFFGTPMEYFYTIYLIAGVQYVFLAVGWVAGAVQEVDKKRASLWKVAFIYIAIISLVSLPLAFVESQQMIKKSEAADEVKEVEWESTIREFGNSTGAMFDFEGASHSVINGEQVHYTISVREIDGEKTIDGMKSSVRIEMSVDGKIINEEELKNEIQLIARESEEESLREQQRQLNAGSEEVYRELAEKHGIDPSKNTVEPFLKELELYGVRNEGEAFRKEVDFAKAENVQYGSYFHMEVDFQEGEKVLREKVIAVVDLLDRLGWIAIDFIVFSDSSDTYGPVKICTMSLLEKQEMLEVALDFRIPKDDSSTIYDQACTPMFQRES